MEALVGLVVIGLAVIGAITALRWLGGRRRATRNQLQLIKQLREERVADDCSGTVRYHVSLT